MVLRRNFVDIILKTTFGYAECESRNAEADNCRAIGFLHGLSCSVNKNGLMTFEGYRSTNIFSLCIS